MYAARPGLRIWKANHDGKVLATMIFKESVNAGEPVIETVDLSPQLGSPVPGEQKQFGPLLAYCDKFLVTYQKSSVWVLDPETGYVIGCHSNLGRIIDINVSNNELFVLTSGDDHFIRKISFETRVMSPCIEVQELDLNNPAQVAEIQRASSFSSFQDSDKLNKLFDGIVSNVKSQAKRIKEQITYRESSEDIETSDTDRHPATSPRIMNRIRPIREDSQSPGHSTVSNDEDDHNSNSEEEVTRKLLVDSGHHTSGSTDGEKLGEQPFDSSDDNSIKGDADGKGDAMEVIISHRHREKEIPFQHLSKEALPSDIVFEGTSKPKKKRRKKQGDVM